MSNLSSCTIVCLPALAHVASLCLEGHLQTPDPLSNGKYIFSF